MIDSVAMQRSFLALVSSFTPFQRAQLPQMAERQGWIVVEQSQATATLDGFWTPGESMIQATLSGDRIDEFVIRLTETVGDDLAAQEVLDTAFAQLVEDAWVNSRPVDDQRPGARGEALWRTAYGTAAVTRADHDVRLIWVHNEIQDIRDRSRSRREPNEVPLIAPVLQDGTWPALEDRIAALIPRMSDGDTLILDHGPYLMQMQQGVPDLVLEANGPEIHEPDQQVTPAVKEKMRAILWHEHEGSMWSRTHAWPVNTGWARRIATLWVRTLRDIHGAASPRDLQVQQFNAFRP